MDTSRELTHEMPCLALGTLAQDDALLVRLPRELVGRTLAAVGHGAGESDAQTSLDLPDRLPFGL